MVSLETIAEILKGSQSVLVVTHVSPDPDAVGSCGALTMALQSMGIETDFFLTSAVPYKMSKLLPFDPIRELPEKRYSTVAVIDCANTDRLGEEFRDQILSAANQIICIDHHISHSNFTNLCYVEPTKSSSAQLIYDLLRILKAEISPKIADLLYAGLCDDTGSFRWSNANEEAFTYAAYLVKAGANPSEVSRNMYFSIPARILKLRAYALSALEYYCDGRVCFLPISSKILSELECSDDDTDGLVDEARSGEKVVVAAIIRQSEDRWRFSLRSKSDSVDVNALSLKFGGGGHKLAAGYRRKGDLEVLKRELLEDLAPLVRDINL